MPVVLNIMNHVFVLCKIDFLNSTCRDTSFLHHIMSSASLLRGEFYDGAVSFSSKGKVGPPGIWHHGEERNA